jgi:hypothetical protein
VNRGFTGRFVKSETAADFFGMPWRASGDVGVNRFPPEMRSRPVGFAGKLLDFLVRWLDAFLRRSMGIVEFTNDERCVLRISARRARDGEWLPGGHIAAKGEWIGELHLWNERIPPMPAGGADIVWGTMMRRRLRLSLVMLAEFAQSDPRFSQVKIFCGETAFATGKSLDQTRGMASFFGFEITENRRAPGFWGWWERLGEAFFLWGMVRTFNPGALKRGSLLKPVWFKFWLRRETLLGKYACAKRTKRLSVPTPELTCSVQRAV